MADKEDSIHIKLKLDIDEQDKQFTNNLATNLEQTDQKNVLAGNKSGEKGNTGFIGPPTRAEFDISQLKKEIKKIIKDQKKAKPTDNEEIKKQLENKRDKLLLKKWENGPVGQIADLSKQEFSNLRELMVSPIHFLLGAITKALGKRALAVSRGGIAAAIAILVYELVIFAFKELMAPGRMFDRRFRRLAQQETMSFYDRQLQEEFRHGYQEMRVSTIQGLRGGASQVNGNLFQFSSATTGILQAAPYRSSHSISQSGYLSGNATDRKGNPRRRTVSGRFG